MNNVSTVNFVNDFLRIHENLHVLYLELGVENNTCRNFRSVLWYMPGKNGGN